MIIKLISNFYEINIQSGNKCFLFYVFCFFSLAALYILLEAYFVAVLEVIVYAGAIMVLFLFVIMLINVG